MNAIPPASDFLAEAQNLFEYTRFLRRDFHRHPELGFQEVRTAGIVARELTAMGLEVTSGIAQTGVVALLEGVKPGPVVLARFDMDALPIVEQNSAEYVSRTPGVMHACGHDGHTAVGLTVARLLSDRRQALSGSVKFVFQPAEEGLGGAEGMIAGGILDHPKPDLCLALHLWNERPVGWIGVAPGPVMAGSDIFELQVKGKGGHGAVPHLAIDPVVVASHIVVALQTIVARNVSPLQSAVVTVAMLHGGDAFNVIPSQVTLQGTIRTFDPQVRAHVLRRFSELAQGVAAAFGCTAELLLRGLTPAVVNDASIARHVAQVAARILPDCQVAADYQTMGSEDMSFIMQQVPGCYFFIGSANPDQGLAAPHHHPNFDFDEAALVNAAALMAASAASYLGL